MAAFTGYLRPILLINIPKYVVVTGTLFNDCISQLMCLFQETHTEAAGQVYEMCQDGRIHIRWADASYSYCYPQELFLIGDEVN